MYGINHLMPYKMDHIPKAVKFNTAQIPPSVLVIKLI
jgi:hypothetical protein